MDIFFFTKVEKKVFFALSETSETVTAIAKKAKVPRSSAYKALIALQKMGLVIGRKVREKNKHLFSKLGFEAINHMIEQVRAQLLQNTAMSKVSLPLFAQSAITISKGEKGVLELIHKVISLHQNERVYTVQGLETLKAWSSIFGEKEVLRIHTTFKERSLILVSIRSEKIIGHIRNNEALKKSYEGRMTDLHVLPEECFENLSALYVFRTSLVLIDLEHLIAVEIQDKIITAMIKKLLNHLVKKSERGALI